jgi:hypothetical protein
MPKARRSKEYRQFDTLMGELLTVPKSALNERMAEHRAKVAATPSHKKRGPKPKVTPPSESDASPVEG